MQLLTNMADFYLVLPLIKLLKLMQIITLTLIPQTKTFQKINRCVDKKEKNLKGPIRLLRMTNTFKGEMTYLEIMQKRKTLMSLLMTIKISLLVSMLTMISVIVKYTLKLTKSAYWYLMILWKQSGNSLQVLSSFLQQSRLLFNLHFRTQIIKLGL